MPFHTSSVSSLTTTSHKTGVPLRYTTLAYVIRTITSGFNVFKCCGMSILVKHMENILTIIKLIYL